MANVAHISKNSESFRRQWIHATECLQRSQVREALKIFESLAADGYSEASVEIANIYECGSGDVQQDLDSARAWYMKAVDDSNDSYGYVGLARLAIAGHVDAGTPDDAVAYLKIAADADNPIAQIILGTLYHDGRLVPQDLLAAERLYRRAWSQGYVLPLAYLSKIEFQRGQYWSAARSRVSAVLRALVIARRDRHDPRLWNFLN